MAGDIAISVDGGLATLRLSNPERRNAISAPMWQSIREFAESAGARIDIRVVVIRGDGDLAFSAGADIAGFDQARSGAGDAKGYDDLVEYACRAVEALAQPTIALIKGPCMGAGRRDSIGGEQDFRC
jgi:enoyl-CoA hydratase/carnithine racemase